MLFRSVQCGGGVEWEGNGLAGELLEVGDDDGFIKLQQQYFLKEEARWFYLK